MNTSSPSCHNRGRLEEAGVFIIFLSLALYLAWKRRFPYILDDEYGVLGAAAVLAGFDWSTPADVPFYGFGLSLLIAPLYKLSLDPTTLYRAVLSVNGLLVAMSAVLALKTLHLLKLTLSGFIRLGVVIVAFSYPAVLFYAGLAMGESILLFTLVLALYALTATVGQREPGLYCPVLLGLAIGFAPFAHTRGLVFGLVIVPVFIMGIRLQWLSMRSMMIAGLACVTVVALLIAVKAFLLTHFYTGIRTGTGSVTEFAAERLELLRPERWLTLWRVALGQFTYLMTSTFGLLFIGIMVTWSSIWPALQALRQTPCAPAVEQQRRVLLAVTLGLSFLLMFMVSVLQLGKPSRADHYFYGRYNEVMLAPMLIASLVGVAGSATTLTVKKMLLLIIGFAIGIFLLLLVAGFPAYIFDQDMYWNPLSGWFIHIQDAWEIQPYNIAMGMLAGGVLLLASISLSEYIFLICAGAVFTLGLLHNYSLQHGGADKTWRYLEKVNQLNNSIPVGMNVELLGEAFQARLRGESLQFALPKVHVDFNGHNDPTSAVLDVSGSPCEHRETIWLDNNLAFCFPSEALQTTALDTFSHIYQPASARGLQPAQIKFGETSIKAGGPLNFVCGYAARFFYFGWFRLCLTKVTVTIQRDGLIGDEEQELGIFISDSQGTWHGEIRADLDNVALARNENVKITVPIQFNRSITPGIYKLNAAIFDDKGWDFRSVASSHLLIE